jgi:cytochrome c oxidase cbb3-type subunit 3
MNDTPHAPAPPLPPNVDPLAPERHGPLSFDGIRELDTNPPRIWTVIYITSALAAIWLVVAYPAIPLLSGTTHGVFEWGSRASLTAAAQKAEANPTDIQVRFAQASVEQAEADPLLKEYALAAGRAAFGENCAGCHGREGRGVMGFPNLTDKDWLWGGSVEAIQHTLQVGVRWPGSDDARTSQMPAFGEQRVLERAQVIDLVEYVRSLSGMQHDAAAAARAAGTFADNCAACHGEGGGGNREVGAPNLTDGTWLYGGSREAIYNTIWHSRGGVMPAFGKRLSDDTIRKLVITVRSFGGGE